MRFEALGVKTWMCFSSVGERERCDGEKRPSRSMTATVPCSLLTMTLRRWYNKGR